MRHKGRYTTPSGGRTNIGQGDVWGAVNPKSDIPCQDCDARGHPIFPHRLGRSDVMYRCERCLPRYYPENNQTPRFSDHALEYFNPGGLGLDPDTRRMLRLNRPK